MEVTLTINSGVVEQRVALDDEPLTIGRDEDCDVPLPDDGGLSRRHATLRIRDGRVLVYDEVSTNGSHVNGKKIPKGGAAELSDGDELRIGYATVIAVRIKRAGVAQGSRSTSASAPPSVYLAALFVVAVLLGGTGFLLYGITRPSTGSDNERTETSPTPILNNLRDTHTPTPPPAIHTPTPVRTPAQEMMPSPSPASIPYDDPKPEAGPKLYKQMNKEQRAEFIRQRSNQIAIMMGGRPYAITPEALERIQYWLDSFANRASNHRGGLWGGDTVAILERGKAHAPIIIHAFREYNVPIVVGLYIPFIETEYNNIASDNRAGAAGLFQFLGGTAKLYQVQPEERTNVPKMADAAARYFRDNIAGFGSGPMGVALSIAGYNRAAESVKRDLRNVLSIENNEDKERSFWTLIANQSRLDKPFQNENRDYVPRFFAAAIFGETPWAFGVDMNPLSTYGDASGGGDATTSPVRH